MSSDRIEDVLWRLVNPELDGLNPTGLAALVLLGKTEERIMLGVDFQKAAAAVEGLQREARIALGQIHE